MLVLLFILSTYATIAYTERNILDNYKSMDIRKHCSPIVNFIDFTHKSLFALTNATFSNCPRLEAAKLGHNQINKIESDTFWLLSELTFIDLYNNSISYLDDHLFENNAKLLTVNLSHNPLVVPQFISRSLQSLACDFCKRFEVNEKTFTAIPNIHIISLVGTEVMPFDLKELTALRSLLAFRLNDKHTKRCFQKHDYPTLFLLQRNNVTLGPDVFCNVNHCFQTNNLLICKHIYLTTIEPPTSNVIMSDYSYNLISNVGNEPFVSQHSMRILKLNHNLIKHIESDAFRNLTNLQYIDLSHNKLKNIKDSIFAYNKNLLTVDFSHNSIIVPTLQSNSIEALACDFCKRIVVEEKTLLTMPNLKSLRLLGTEVDPFDENAAKSLSILREFELTRNDSRRCFIEKDYPGLLYLKNRGVILGDDVFCKQVTEGTKSSPYRLTDDDNTRTVIDPLTNGHDQRKSTGTVFFFILSYAVVTLFK